MFPIQSSNLFLAKLRYAYLNLLDYPISRVL